MLPFFPAPGLQDLDIGQPMDFYPKSQIQEPQEAKKLFIKNIPQELTNDNVEKLLKVIFAFTIGMWPVDFMEEIERYHIWVCRIRKFGKRAQVHAPH